jgi:hypothetical protein
MAISPQQRAQLARQNAKPSDASRIAGRTAAQDVYDGAQGSAKANDGSTVESDGRGGVYRYVPKFDHTYHQDASGHTSAPMRGNQLPGSMNKYIDQVLEMSGMNAPSNPPVPQDRPADEPEGAGVPDDGPGSVADMNGMQPSRIAGNNPSGEQDPYKDLNGVDPKNAPPPPAATDGMGLADWNKLAQLGAGTGIVAYLARQLLGKGPPPATSAGPAAASVGPTAAADAAKSPANTAADLAADARTAAFNDTPGTTGAPGAGPAQPSTADWAMQQDARTAGGPTPPSFDDIPGAAGTADARPAAENPDLANRASTIEDVIAETMGESPKNANAAEAIRQPAPPAQKLLTDADAPHTRVPPTAADAEGVPVEIVHKLADYAEAGDLDGMLRTLKEAGIDYRDPQVTTLLRHIQAREPNVADMVPRALGAVRRAIRP